jgi:succinyl-CoA synthetase beta subunit
MYVHYKFTKLFYSYLDVDEYVLKAQVLAGGRGKGHFSNGFKGGVHVTKE